MRRKNPLDYVITIMSQRTGAIGFWDGKNFDNDMNKAHRAENKVELEFELKRIKKTLPKGWVIGLQPYAGKRSKNPVTPSKYAEIKQAIERFKSFTGMDAEHIDEYVIKHPDVALVIGTLDALSYTTKREGSIELYRHKFRKNSRPLLCSSPDGTQLVIFGGKYQFGERGIVDEG